MKFLSIYNRIAGLLILAVGIWLIFIFPQKNDKLPDGFISPIIAYEFCESETEVKSIFHWGSKDFTATKEAMDKGNILDFLYMWLYSTFLISFAILAHHQKNDPSMFLVVLLGVAALFGDIMENVQLLLISSKIGKEVIQEQLQNLHLYTWIKWGSLTFSFIFIALHKMKTHVIWNIYVGLAAFTFLAAVAAFIHRGLLSEIFALAIMIDFLILILYILPLNRFYQYGRTKVIKNISV